MKMKKNFRIIPVLALLFSLCLVCFAACGEPAADAKKYSVTLNACVGVTVDCPEEVKENEDLTFTVKLNDGYEGELDVKATVGGEETVAEKGDAGAYTIKNVKGDVAITISGARQQITEFSVTVNKCDGAIVSGLDETVPKGGALTFSVGIEEGYEGTPDIKATVGGKEANVSGGIGNFVSIGNIDGDVVITITGLTRKSLAVTKTAGEGVTINGEETVLYGEDYTFTVTLAEGYKGAVVAATVGGKVVECTLDNGVYTIKAVKDVLSLDVRAEGRKEYIIDFRTESEHIVLPESGKAEYGKSFAFDIVPEEGYVFDGEITVKANEVEISKNADGKWEIANITEYQDVEVIAAVKEITYAITYTADIAEGLGEQTVKHYAYSAATVKFKVVLAADYSKSAITVTYAYGDNEDETLTADEEGYYSFPNVKADVTISVTGLTLDVYTVSFKLGDEVKQTVEVRVHEKLTEEQLAAAAEEVVKGSEFKFVKWNENTDVEITEDCSFVAVTLWGEGTANKMIRDEKTKLTASEDTETPAPENFEKVYKYVWNEGENPNANSISAMNIAKYNKVGFKLMSNHWVLFDGWNFANIFSDWAEFTIVKNDRANYTLTIVYGEKTYTETLKGETVANMFVSFGSGFVSDVSELYTLWTTEIRVVEDHDYVPAAAEGKLIGAALREDKNLGVVSDIAAPMGYETVYKAKDPDMAAIDITKYSEVRMGIMMNGYYLFKPDWSALGDKRGVWLEIKLTKTESGWTAKVSNLYQGGDLYSTTSESNILNEIVNWGFSLASDESAQMLYVTELRGTVDPAYGVVDKSIYVGGVKNETETIPDGYDSLYSYTYENDTYDADAMIKMPLADISLEEYDTVSFRIMSDQELFFDGWGVYVNRGVWTEIVMTKVDGGWKITSSATLQGGNASTWLESVHAGTTLAEVFGSWELREKYAGEGQGHFYATNLIVHKIAG